MKLNSLSLGESSVISFDMPESAQPGWYNFLSIGVEDRTDLQILTNAERFKISSRQPRIKDVINKPYNESL